MEDIRRFEFNTIYVIDSLDEKRQTDKTGEILFNDILKPKTWQITFFHAFLKKVNSRLEFFSVLESIKEDIKSKSYIPFLHFEIHGSKEGFVLNSDELITWEEFANKSREINKLTNNNLFVSLATCHGAYISGAVPPMELSPFWGFVGPWEEVFCQDIMVDFTSFFECILDLNSIKNLDFDRCIKVLNESNELSTRYYFLLAETIFEYVYKDYEQKFYQPKALEERINRLIAERRKDIIMRHTETLAETRKYIEKYLIDDKEKRKTEYKRKFLLKE